MPYNGLLLLGLFITSSSVTASITSWISQTLCLRLGWRGGQALAVVEPVSSSRAVTERTYSVRVFLRSNRLPMPLVAQAPDRHRRLYESRGSRVAESTVSDRLLTVVEEVETASLGTDGVGVAAVFVVLMGKTRPNPDDHPATFAPRINQAQCRQVVLTHTIYECLLI